MDTYDSLLCTVEIGICHELLDGYTKARLATIQYCMERCALSNRRFKMAASSSFASSMVGVQDVEREKEQRVERDAFEVVFEAEFGRVVSRT